LWSVPDGRVLGSLEGVSAVRAIAFSPDGSVLATASQDQVLRLWSMPDRQPLAVIDRHAAELNDVAFDDTGRLISAGADGTAQVWVLDPGHAVSTLCRLLDPATIPDAWPGLGPDLGDPPRCPA
jgi:WD40 repeat protein